VYLGPFEAGYNTFDMDQLCVGSWLRVMDTSGIECGKTVHHFEHIIGWIEEGKVDK